MLVIDDYTNPSNILSITDTLMISNKEYLFLKQLGIKERESIIKNNPQINNHRLNKLLIDTLNKESIYPNLSIIKKQIEHLKTIIRFRSIIKNHLQNKFILTKELKDNIIIYKKVTNILINIFNKEFNCNNSTIILNRISEMLITSKDLFQTNSKSNNLTKKKY